MNHPHVDEYTARCADERCEVKQSCFLWTDRHNPQASATARSLRKNWESHKIPCEVNQALFGRIDNE